MATGIKTLKRISRPFPEKTRLLLNDLMMYTTLKNNCCITLEKQLSWAVKMCFNRKKYDSSDLKLKLLLANSANKIFLGIQSTKLFYETYQ